MDDLKEFLSSAAGQHIQQVYLNDKKEWLFAPRPGFETVLKREDVLALKTPPAGPAQITKQVSDTGSKRPGQDHKNLAGISHKPKQSNRF